MTFRFLVTAQNLWANYIYYNLKVIFFEVTMKFISRF
ncbi:hypothetical protein [Roseburia intestinalis]